MAGTLVANTINTDTGLFSTNNAYLGIAKAWVNFTGTGGTVTINNSFNCSSITRQAAGTFTFNFTTAMATAYYAQSGGASGSASTFNAGAVQFNQTPSTGVLTNPTTTSFIFASLNSGGSNFDPSYCSVVVFSS